jgi:hypothetical protein
MPGKLLAALAMCEDAIAQNEQNIADQEGRVTRKEAAGASASLSKALLKTFQQLRLSHLSRRQTILCDLAAFTNRRIAAWAAVDCSPWPAPRSRQRVEDKPASRFMIRGRTRVMQRHPQGDW